MAELINTDFGVVARVKNGKGALKHRKIVPITDEAELAAYKGRYPVKFIPLTDAEDNWLKNNYASLTGAIKEGAIESAYKHAASAAEFANQAMKGGYRELETRERAKNRALNSPYRRTSPSERQETAVEIAIRDNPWKDKDDPALIEARNRWTEQAENRDANQGYYGHEIVGGLSEGLTSPTTFIPGVAAGRGVGALGKAAVAGGALNVADEALRVYGDDTLTNSEKAARLGLAGAFGAAGGALINAATQGARKGVDAFKKWRSAKNPTDAQALDISSNINRNFDDLINGELSESSEVIPAYELPESKITRKAREAAENFSETAGDTFGPVPMGSGRFPMLERKVKNTKTKVPREIVRNEEKIKDIISRSLIRHENKPLLKRTADADSNRRLQSEQIAKSVSEHRKELISDLRNAAAYPEEIKRIVSEFDRINAPADKPALTITGKEFGNYKDIKDLRNRAAQYYKDNLSGKKVETEAGEVFFPIKGFKKPISNSETGKLLLFRRLPDILRSGKLASIEPDRTGRQNIKEWLVFETPVNINGKDEIARINVRRDNNGRLYYDHVIKKEFSGKTPIRLKIPAGPENSLNKSATHELSGIDVRMPSMADKISQELQAAPVNNLIKNIAHPAEKVKGKEPNTFRVNNKGILNITGADGLERLFGSQEYYQIIDNRLVKRGIGRFDKRYKKEYPAESVRAAEEIAGYPLNLPPDKTVTYSQLKDILVPKNESKDGEKYIEQNSSDKIMPVSGDKVQDEDIIEKSFELSPEEEKQLKKVMREISPEYAKRAADAEAVKSAIRDASHKGLSEVTVIGRRYTKVGDKWILDKKLQTTESVSEISEKVQEASEELATRSDISEAEASLNNAIADDGSNGATGFQKYLADTTKQNLSRGIVGGIAGVGKEGYDSYSEDREFSFSEAGKNALVGFGAAGPGLGFTIKSVGKNSKRPTTVDSSAERINGGLFGKVRRVIDRIGETDTANYWINTKFNKRTDYLNFREDFMRGIREAHSKLEIVYKALNELTLDQRTELHKYLVGEGEAAPKAIKELGDKFRREINRLGSRAVNLGILSRDTFDEWKNIYLHRSYQDTLFGNLSKLGRSKSVHPIYKRGKEWTGNKDELQRYMEAGMIGDHISAGKIVYKKNSNGSYTFRRDWTPEERANMGEITDGAFTITETLARLNDMIYAGEFLRNVAIGTNTAVKEEIHGYKRLNGQKWGALKDLYVPKDVYDDLNNTYNNLFGHQNDWLRLWNKYISSLKSSWTVLNPIAHFNNFISNIAFMSTSGMPITKAFTGAMRSWGILKEADKLKSIKARQIAGTATNADAEEYARLISNDDVKMFFEAEANGVFGRGRLQEMLYNHGVADVVSNNPLKRGYDQVDNMLQKAYEAEDNAGRLAFYSYLRKDLGLSTEEAVKGVREIIPDYTSPISSGANMLRNTGVMPFVSWTYNTLPMIIKQTYGVLANPLGKSKYGSGSFGLGKYQAYNSLKAVFGVLLLNQIISGVTGAPSMLNGEQPRNWQGRRFTWGYDGDVYGLKIDRWLPHSDFLPLNVGSWGYNQLTGGIPQKAITALAGVDAYHGTPITRREGLEKIYDYGKYAGNNFIPIPEYLRRAGGMIESAIADEDKRRRSNFYNPRGALSSLAGLAGLNVSSYNRDAYLKEEENKKLKSEKKEKKNKRKELIDERKKRREKLYPNRRKKD